MVRHSREGYTAKHDGPERGDAKLVGTEDKRATEMAVECSVMLLLLRMEMLVLSIVLQLCYVTLGNVFLTVLKVAGQLRCLISSVQPFSRVLYHKRFHIIKPLLTDSAQRNIGTR